MGTQSEWRLPPHSSDDIRRIADFQFVPKQSLAARIADVPKAFTRMLQLVVERVPSEARVADK